MKMNTPSGTTDMVALDAETARKLTIFFENMGDTLLVASAFLAAAALVPEPGSVVEFPAGAGAAIGSIGSHRAGRYFRERAEELEQLQSGEAGDSQTPIGSPLADAISRIDDASLVIEAAGQELAGAASLLRDTADRLGQRLDELFGEREGEPGEQGADTETRQIAFRPSGGGAPGQGVALDGAAVRFEQASRAGWIYADTLDQIAQAGEAVAPIIIVWFRASKPSRPGFTH